MSSIQSFVDVIGGPGKVDQIKKVFGFDAVKALRKLLDYENKTMVHSKILNAYMYFITGDFFEEWNEFTPQLTSENLENKQLEDGCLARSHI